MNESNAAEKMCKKHDTIRNDKTIDFKLRETFQSKVDVGGTDMPGLPCLIEALFRDKLKITSEYGILGVH